MRAREGRTGGPRLRLHPSSAVTVVVLTSTLALGLLPVTAADRAPAWYWLGGLAVALAFLACVVVHEVAHVLAARRHGVGTERITLWLLGGVAERDSEAPGPRADAVIAVAGPAASVLTGAVFWAVALVAQPMLAPVPLASLLWLGTANLLLALVALLPGSPLDGGRLVRALVWARTGDRARGERVARRCGRVIGVLLLAGGAVEVILFGQFVGIWLSVLGWLVLGTRTLPAPGRERVAAGGPPPTGRSAAVGGPGPA
ncbi:peptidase [Saccharomonospora piscinae]|uniref:Peptidase n=1 Tax=Saccharomonospora piscinae TaxID=687388 RepID=A0A1V9A9S0_SACPI|nr:site-2 protease family protein [Saccharomonospora piscinae]OQO93877.1 peptidase [Saccharomonospora piscinae]